MGSLMPLDKCFFAIFLQCEVALRQAQGPWPSQKVKVPEPVEGPTVNQEAYEDVFKTTHPNHRSPRAGFLQQPDEANGASASPI